MKKFIFLLMIVAIGPLIGFAQTDALPAQFCVQGSMQSATSGLSSSNYLQGVIPYCTVTVYLTGTTTKATIYSDAVGTPLTNPFQARSNGQFLIYALDNQGYDLVMSGGIAQNTYTTPVTLTDLIVSRGGTGSGCSVTGIGQTDVLTVYPTGSCYGDSLFTWDHVNLNLIIGTTTTIAAGAVSTYLIGPFNHDAQGDVTDYVFGDNNTITGTPGSLSNVSESAIVGMNNLISVTPSARSGIAYVGAFGEENKITSTVNGIGTTWLFGIGNTVEDIVAATREIEVVGENNDVNGSISTVQILGFLNRANNVSYDSTQQVNGVVAGSENTILHTGGLTIQDFSTIFGHLNYMHDCADCLAVGAGVEEATNHEMGIGMSRVPELKFTSGNVKRSPSTLGLPAPIANAYLTAVTGLPTSTGTCNVAFTGGTGSGGTGVISIIGGQTSLGLPIEITVAGSYSVAPTGITLSNGTLTCSGSLTVQAYLSVIPACTTGLEGSFAAFTDASVNTWGSTIAGGGANHVFGYCDGTNWTVMAK